MEQPVLKVIQVMLVPPEQTVLLVPMAQLALKVLQAQTAQMVNLPMKLQ
jgi:hypothetical protein